MLLPAIRFIPSFRAIDGHPRHGFINSKETVPTIFSQKAARIFGNSLLRTHTHEHAHAYWHVHGGTKHAHVVVHSHPHDHILGEGRHRHRHRHGFADG